MVDPLERLPAEVVLRVLDYCSIPSVAKLTRINSSWHKFIDKVHQDTVYSSPSKTSHPAGSRDLSFLEHSSSFARYFEGTASFKDLCRRQTLLSRNWNRKEPITRESVVQVGNDALWRFRADFKRRSFISTSQQGGLNVTDMDTGNLLWRLPNDRVGPFAHLEYQDGTAVFNREGNDLEIWKTDLEGLPRGAFRQTAILPHDCQTRGFQFSYSTLCVVSTEGQGFVYDMTRDPPELRTHMEIENDAVGHLDQTAEVVMYSMGKKGYHIHDKTTGSLLGIIQPKLCKNLFHINHPEQPRDSIVSTGSALSSLPSVEVYPPKQPSRDRLVPIDVFNGPLDQALNSDRIRLEDDEWGAALISDNLMVGISRGGRVVVCPDWRAALRNHKNFEDSAALIECERESDDSSFDIGGWLSVHDNRMMFEVRGRIYVVALGGDGQVLTSEHPNRRPSHCFSTSSATQLAVPVSFMALWDDCIMSTYTVRDSYIPVNVDSFGSALMADHFPQTLGWRKRGDTDEQHQQRDQQRFRIFPTKTIRVLSLAHDEGEVPSKSAVPAVLNEDTHAQILEIMDMLSEEEDDEENGDAEQL